MDERLERTLAEIDRLNAEDPVRELIGGQSQPRELVYAHRLTAWLTRLKPDASDLLRIAVRGQHVQRWHIPRDQYPLTRAGYLKWRETLKRLHADIVSDVMRRTGYDAAALQRVQALILKRVSDEEAQALEDALCLVFLETQFTGLRAKTAPETMTEVLRKTWRKMSPAAHRAALALPMTAEDRQMLDQALAEPGPPTPPAP